jgi:16S rRNA (cytosine1402-N4)-methyltransferase
VDPVAQLAASCQRAADCTVGAGGHAARLRDLGAEVFAVDRDPAAIEQARTARFRPEFVLLDLGVSSGQLDLDERGFSFRRGVPLDMRLSGEGPTAADILNHRSAGALADIFRRYGDESRSRRLATRIVERRARQPFHTSDDLVNAIRSALGPRSGPSDFARLFQAVRIAVNDELGELERALPGLRDALVSEGRLAVITYHSGEDRIVKRAFRDWARVCVCPPPQPICTCRGRPLGRCDPRKPILPTPEEIRANRRARSAKLRAFRVVHGA